MHIIALLPFSKSLPLGHYAVQIIDWDAVLWRQTLTKIEFVEGGTVGKAPASAAKYPNTE